jgi:hypothetical protein
MYENQPHSTSNQSTTHLDLLGQRDDVHLVQLVDHVHDVALPERSGWRVCAPRRRRTCLRDGFARAIEVDGVLRRLCAEAREKRAFDRRLGDQPLERAAIACADEWDECGRIRAELGLRNELA